MTGKGLVYVMYHTKTLEDAETAQPVKIHFASGTVNGYFDSQKEEHQGRWSELLGKATDKYFDVVGKYAHLTFETNDFRIRLLTVKCNFSDWRNMTRCSRTGYI